MLLLLASMLTVLSAFVMSPPAAGAVVAGRVTPEISMAHHVQKKATRGHNAFRPRKSRPSDINRKAPEYPTIPDIPWMVPLESLSEVAEAKAKK